MWASGAFDYPADSVGFTLGHHRRAQPAELGGARLGYFLVADQPATTTPMISPCVARGGYVGELEMRYQPVRPRRRDPARRLARQRLRRLLQRRRGAGQPQSRPDGQRHHRPGPGRAAPSTASISTSSRSSATTSAPSCASAGTTGAREIMSYTDIDLSLSARPFHQRRVVGPAEATRSASAAPSTTSRAPTPTGWRTADSASRSATAR